MYIKDKLKRVNYIFNTHFLKKYIINRIYTHTIFDFDIYYKFEQYMLKIIMQKAIMYK